MTPAGIFADLRKSNSSGAFEHRSRDIAANQSVGRDAARQILHPDFSSMQQIQKVVPGSRESNPLEEANESPASRYYSQSRPAINFQSIEADGGMADAQERHNTLA